MGCGASKGKSEGGEASSETIEFKKVDVWSIDDFFGQAETL